MLQPSRKGAKAWRKNIDIQDVQKGLEEVQDQIVASGGVVSERTDATLFEVDLAGDQRVVKRMAAEKPLKADEILKKRSAVPGLSSQKRRRHEISFAERERLKKIAGRITTTRVNPDELSDQVKIHGSYDVWGNAGSQSSKGRIAAKSNVKAPATLKHEPTRLSALNLRIPAIRAPDGGISFNPALTDWERVIEEEGAAEKVKEVKRLHEEERQRKILELAAEQEEEERTEASEVESASPNPQEVRSVKLPQRKTSSQRNKEMHRKQENLDAAQKRREKRMLQDLYSLKSIKRSLALSSLKRQQTRKALTNEVDHQRQLRRRRLGRNHVVPPLLEVKLADELTDSLRRLHPEGNLLRDRFRSYQERGILEGRVPIVRRAGKKFTTEKYSHKNIDPQWRYF